MKDFKELCEAHLEFERVVEEKCNEYCTIHKCENPYHEDDAVVYIGDDTITISYKIYDCGDYDCASLKIPMSFFESDEHSEEEQKALEKAKVITDVKSEINELQAQEKILRRDYDGMKKDINDIERLQKLYDIKNTSESAQLHSKIESTKISMSEITHKMGILYETLRKQYEI